MRRTIALSTASSWTLLRDGAASFSTLAADEPGVPLQEEVSGRAAGRSGAEAPKSAHLSPRQSCGKLLCGFDRLADALQTALAARESARQPHLYRLQEGGSPRPWLQRGLADVIRTAPPVPESAPPPRFFPRPVALPALRPTRPSQPSPRPVAFPALRPARPSQISPRPIALPIPESARPPDFSGNRDRQAVERPCRRRSGRLSDPPAAPQCRPRRRSAHTARRR